MSSGCLYVLTAVGYKKLFESCDFDISKMALGHLVAQLQLLIDHRVLLIIQNIRVGRVCFG